MVASMIVAVLEVVGTTSGSHKKFDLTMPMPSFVILLFILSFRFPELVS